MKPNHFIARILALFLSCALAVPARQVSGGPNSALALRVENGGLEEQTPTTREIRRNLLGESSPRQTNSPGFGTTGLEEQKPLSSREAMVEEVLREIRSRHAAKGANNKFRVGVDGISNAGKKTLANELAQRLGAGGYHPLRLSEHELGFVSRSERDQWQAEGDPRFRNWAAWFRMDNIHNALDLVNQKVGTYTLYDLYDWETREANRTQSIEIFPDTILIYNGMGLADPERYPPGTFDLLIHLIVPEEISEERLVQRDSDSRSGRNGETIRMVNQIIYLPLWRNYLEKIEPQRKADLVYDTSDFNRPIRLVYSRAGLEEEPVEEKVRPLLSLFAMGTKESQQEAAAAIREIGPASISPLLSALQVRPTRKKAGWTRPRGAALALAVLGDQIPIQQRPRVVSSLAKILSVQQIRKILRIDPRLQGHPHTWLTWVLPAVIQSLRQIDPETAAKSIFELTRATATEKGLISVVVDKAIENASTGLEEIKIFWSGGISNAIRPTLRNILVTSGVAEKFSGKEFYMDVGSPPEVIYGPRMMIRLTPEAVRAESAQRRQGVLGPSDEGPADQTLRSLLPDLLLNPLAEPVCEIFSEHESTPAGQWVVEQMKHFAQEMEPERPMTVWIEHGAVTGMPKDIARLQSDFDGAQERMKSSFGIDWKTELMKEDLSPPTERFLRNLWEKFRGKEKESAEAMLFMHEDPFRRELKRGIIELRGQGRNVFVESEKDAPLEAHTAMLRHLEWYTEAFHSLSYGQNQEALRESGKTSHYLKEHIRSRDEVFGARIAQYHRTHPVHLNLVVRGSLGHPQFLREALVAQGIGQRQVINTNPDSAVPHSAEARLIEEGFPSMDTPRGRRLHIEKLLEVSWYAMAVRFGVQHELDEPFDDLVMALPDSILEAWFVGHASVNYQGIISNLGDASWEWLAGFQMQMPADAREKYQKIDATIEHARSSRGPATSTGLEESEDSQEWELYIDRIKNLVKQQVSRALSRWGVWMLPPRWGLIVEFDLLIGTKTEQFHPEWALVKSRGKDWWIHLHLRTADERGFSWVSNGLLFQLILSRTGKIIGLKNSMAEREEIGAEGFVPLKGLIPGYKLRWLTKAAWVEVRRHREVLEKTIRKDKPLSVLGIAAKMPPSSKNPLYQMLSVKALRNKTRYRILPWTPEFVRLDRRWNISETTAGMEEDPPAFKKYHLGLIREINNTSSGTLFSVHLDENGSIQKISLVYGRSQKFPKEAMLSYEPLDYDSFSNYRVLMLGKDGLWLVDVLRGKLIRISPQGKWKEFFQPRPYKGKTQQAMREVLQAIGEADGLEAINVDTREKNTRLGSVTFVLRNHRRVVRLLAAKRDLIISFLPAAGLEEDLEIQLRGILDQLQKAYETQSWSAMEHILNNVPTVHEKESSPKIQNLLLKIQEFRISFLLSPHYADQTPSQAMFGHFQEALPILVRVLKEDETLSSDAKEWFQEALINAVRILGATGRLTEPEARTYLLDPQLQLHQGSSWLLLGSFAIGELLRAHASSGQFLSREDPAVKGPLLKAFSAFPMIAMAGSKDWISQSSEVERFLEFARSLIGSFAGGVGEYQPEKPSAEDLGSGLTCARQLGALPAQLRLAAQVQDSPAQIYVAAVGARMLEAMAEWAGLPQTAESFHQSGDIWANEVRTKHPDFWKENSWGHNLFKKTAGLEESEEEEARPLQRRLTVSPGEKLTIPLPTGETMQLLIEERGPNRGHVIIPQPLHYITYRKSSLQSGAGGVYTLYKTKQVILPLKQKGLEGYKRWVKQSNPIYLFPISLVEDLLKRNARPEMWRIEALCVFRELEQNQDGSVEVEMRYRAPSSSVPPPSWVRDSAASSTGVPLSSISTGLEEQHIMEKLAGLEEAIQGAGVIVMEAPVLRNRVGLEEFANRIHGGLANRLILVGLEETEARMLHERNPFIRTIPQGDLAGLVTVLVGLEEADKVTHVGKTKVLADRLARLLPFSMTVIHVGPHTGLEELLHAMGVPVAVLPQVQASGLEEQLARQRAA